MKKVYLEFNGNLDIEIKEIFNAGVLIRIVVSVITMLAVSLSDGVVCVTKGIKTYYEKYYPSFRGKTRVFSNGGFAKQRTREKGFSRKGVYLGSDIYWSGLEDVYKIRERLLKRNIQLDIFISDKTGLRTKEFEGGNYDFGIAVFNMKSKKLINGISPIKYFSYLSHGIPVIVPDVPDINKITLENKIGFVYKNKKEIETIIEYLYEMPNYEEMSDRAYAVIQNKYNWEIIAQEMIKWMAK